MTKYNFKFWHYGLIITALLSGFLGYNLWLGDKRVFISGPPTHGHHQIEMACTSCHGEGFSEASVMQNACESCHLDALDKFSDTHPKSKFTDPRNAELLSHLDATQCVSCHREHKPEITRAYGVTLAKDFCAHCHQDIAEERDSHKEFGFETCTNSGCHNYHDNTALYENFLRKHVNEPALSKKPKIPALTGLIEWSKKNKQTPALQQHDADAPIESSNQEIVSQWALSHHATANVNCTQCHSQNDDWQSKGTALTIDSCVECHIKQNESFKQGKHGMRLADKLNGQLSPMSPALASLPMHKDAMEQVNTCVSCHDPHQPNLTFAAADACLACHKDEHSTNFYNSKHGQLWRDSQNGLLPVEQAVSCATCHMPRLKKGKKVHAEHNQNANLQPNSKMIRSVCSHCHGVEFTLEALANEAQIQSNFSNSLEGHHSSMDLVRDRIEQRKKQ